MQHFNSPNVYYLENTEFDSNYRLGSNLINRITGAPFFSGITIVMVQGVYCGYCTQFKPVFQQVADELTPQGIEFATIQVDGEQVGEQIFKGDALTQILKQPLQGVPMIVKFYQGQPIDQYQGERTYDGLKQWALSN